MWPAGFAAAAINIAMLPREGLSGMDDPDRRSHGRRSRSSPASSSSLRSFSITSSRPGISSAGPIRSAARPAIEQVVDRAQAQLQKTGATWIATTDYRTYAMLRWYLQRPRAGHPDQRARPVPGLSRSRHGCDQGPCRALCRARARQCQPGVAVDDRDQGAARTGRAQLARHRDGHLCAGKTDRLDAGAFAAAGFAALSLARAGGRTGTMRHDRGFVIAASVR